MSHPYRTPCPDWYDRLKAGETITGPNPSTLAVAGPEWVLGHLVDLIAAGPIYDGRPSPIWLRAVELYGRQIGLFHRQRPRAEVADPVPAAASVSVPPDPGIPDPHIPDPGVIDPRILDMLRRLVAEATTATAPTNAPRTEPEAGPTPASESEPEPPAEEQPPSPPEAPPEAPSAPEAAPIPTPANDTAAPSPTATGEPTLVPRDPVFDELVTALPTLTTAERAALAHLLSEALEAKLARARGPPGIAV